MGKFVILTLLPHTQDEREELSGLQRHMLLAGGLESRLPPRLTLLLPARSPHAVPVWTSSLLNVKQNEQIVKVAGKLWGRAALQNYNSFIHSFRFRLNQCNFVLHTLRL